MFNWLQIEWIKSTQGNAIFAQFQFIKNERILKEIFSFMLVQEEIGDADLL